MSQPPHDKQSARRAAFQADLRQRLSALEDVAARLRSGALQAGDARRVLLAQLHDIKGCGAPYGVPEATDLARDGEERLSRLPEKSDRLADVLDALIKGFRGVVE